MVVFILCIPKVFIFRFLHYRENIIVVLFMHVKPLSFTIPIITGLVSFIFGNIARALASVIL